jgi:hypothetical protein
MHYKHLYCLLAAFSLFGCATHESLSISETEAGARSLPALRIEEKIREIVNQNKDWEMAQFRTYRQEDLDGDGIDDTILLTTFEHGNNWRRELFVSLSSSPITVMHIDLGGKGEREADDIEVKDRKIIVKGKKYADGDAMCCPSIPYESTFTITNGMILENK